MRKLIIIIISLCATIPSLYSQTRTVKGRLISEDLEIVGLARIMINDTVEVGRTDLNGYFQIDIPISEKKLSFTYVGMDPTALEISGECEVEVVMMLSHTYDFSTPRQVNRLERKRFKKLPELHKQAFDKGLFKTDKACYAQEFIPGF